jgi:RNA-directed DNA polymerase
MIKKSLRTLFDAVHHGKLDFGDFMNGPIDSHYDVVSSGPSGHRREIVRPDKVLKSYLTFLKAFVIEYLPINEDVVFSYRKGFSAYDAVVKHARSRHFFQADIEAFFPNIDRDLVKRTILSAKEDSPVLDLEDVIDRLLELVCVDGFLPIGFPTSAPISNAILFEFDKDTAAFCRQRDLVLTRYSDDIVISGQSKDSLNGIEQEIQTRLSDLASDRFRLNAGKSRHFQVGGKIKILGLMILPNGKITIDTKLKSEMEVLLHYYLNDRKTFVELNKGEEDSGSDKLTGYLNYANAIDSSYLSKLRRKFGATTVDILMHRALPRK